MPVSRTLPLHSPRTRLERGSGDPLVDRLDPETSLREAACMAIPLDALGVHALRDSLLDDPRARVRRSAALRLARVDAALAERVVPWLIEVLADRSPSVRDAACHALATIALELPSRADRQGSVEALERRLLEDPVWWVRRAAARALAAVSSDPRVAIERLLAGLADPFWRVRHAVVHALALVLSHADERELLQRELLARGETLASEPARAALVYLAREWPIGEDFPALAGSVGDPGGIELDDPDPAVVTARLLAGSEHDVARLIPLLGESHEPLRREAARRLAHVKDVARLRPILAWLDEPRLPNAPLAVAELLARLGGRARPLVEPALVSGRAGALAWAAGWIAEHPADDLHDTLLDAAAGRLSRVTTSAERRVAVALLDACGSLLARGHDEHHDAWLECIRLGFACEELDVRDAAAAAALVAGRPQLALASLERISPALRARVLVRLDVATLEPALVERLRADADGRVRAALVAPGGGLDDGDPRVRIAGLVPDTAARLLDDPDASVRRAAARELGHTGNADELPARTLALRDSDDAWLRARSLAWLDPGLHALDDEAIATLLLASRDGAAMVRASAADRLAALAPARVEPLLDDARVEVRKAAWTQLAFASADAPAITLARLAQAREQTDDPALREHLDALSIAFGGEVAALPIGTRSAARASTPATVAQVERRTLGDSGIELAPLVVSGAFDLMPGSLAHAVERGVDTFFWEPRYANLTRFLRQSARRGLQVIAGSFHADRAGIVADVELALRRLEREQLDVFLLFWARSAARLGATSLDVLRELQASGKIRSFGFSTHDRTIACEAIATGAWPIVMTRHSAAHPGAELELLPQARAAGVGVLGFSALCYGRMLRGSSVFERGPAAIDCYRYALAQAGMSACISAPRRHRELVDNLALLERPALEPEHVEALRAHGREVHADNKRFDRLVRRGGAAPLREAILELFERGDEAELERLH